MRLRLTYVALALASFVALATQAQVAAADVPIQSFGLLPSSTQAGGHPDLEIGFSLKNSKRQQLDPGINTPCDCENPRFATVHAPAGLVGNPHAAPQCTTAQLATETCPVDSQVGVVQIGLSTTPADEFPVVQPVYNMVPREGEAGLLVATVFGAPIFQVFSARTGSDYGLDTKIMNYNGFPTGYVNQVLWGVPADPSHNPLRFAIGHQYGAQGAELCDSNGILAMPSSAGPTSPPSGPLTMVKICGGSAQPGAPSNSPLTPFLQAPTNCGVPLQSSLDVLSYDGGSTNATAPYPSTTGCDQLSFNPSLAAKPTTSEADSPSGIDVDLTVPQFESPATPSPSEIRATTVTLPPGFTINANAADGKGACTDARASFGSLDRANCPENAKIGTLEIDSAILPGTLPGYVYLGAPLPGNRYRVFLVADGFNVHVKLAGTLTPNPLTGQLALAFNELPQTPFSRFTLHIFGSERGSLATPAKCGTYEVSTAFTPWDSVLPDQTSKQTFTIDSGPGGSACPGPTRPFAPSFAAAAASNTGGAHAPFSVDLTRSDGDQLLSGLSVTTPPGLSATLKNIPYCSQAAIDQLGNTLYSGIGELSSPACPAASQIGTAVAAAGAGSKPLYVNGKVYLAGPYKGAPLSLVAVIPAVSGPYDLGNVAVRAAIKVNPVNAQITTVSDPLPQIIDGIPLRGRQIQVNLDRKGFALNPTNCDPFLVTATVSGDEGGVAHPSVPFQVASCGSLRFAPKLDLRFSGSTKRAGNPSLKAVLTYPKGGSYANVASTAVTLPPTELIDNAHIQQPCTKPQFASEKCPSGSLIGTAVAETPLLGQPLEGPVYLASGYGHTLPDLLVDLKGQIDIVLNGRIDTVHNAIRTTFENVPDAPVSKFTLRLYGGRKGLLANKTNLCKRSLRTMARIVGQNGMSANQRPVLRTSCGSKARDVRHKRPEAVR